VGSKKRKVEEDYVEMAGGSRVARGKTVPGGTEKERKLRGGWHWLRRLGRNSKCWAKGNERKVVRNEN
jgi:hypothetical protein